MKIYKIEFSKEKPYTQLLNKQVISTYYSEVDKGFWLVYSDRYLSSDEVMDICQDNENIQEYLCVYM